MTDRKCPVSIADIFQAKFKPFTESDWYGYAGVEGDGYIARITVGNVDYEVVLGVGDDTVLEVYYLSPTHYATECWRIEIPAFTQIL